MDVFEKIKDINAYATKAREQGLTIGFVPTMGALHEGHLSLVKKAIAENDVVIVSIFVNPIQFNNPEDLAKYPREIGKDLALLQKEGVHVVFTPSDKEMYPETVSDTYNLGSLSSVMEGKFRPGHFNGVAVVVHKFFQIIQPHKAYFGEKDYQQLLIIKALVRNYNIPVEIVGCPINREADGLARSSRNSRLSPQMKEAAPFIHQQLVEAIKLAKELTAEELENHIILVFEKHPLFKLEYFTIANGSTLDPIKGKITENSYGFIAVYAGDIRLIDNIRLI